MLGAVLSGFATVLAAPWIQRIGRGVAGWLIALLPLGLMIYFARFIEPIAVGDVFVIPYAWVPSLGLNLSFLVDGLSLLFALLISGIGALVVIYAGSYLAGHHQLGRFYAYLLGFMASMLGLVLADNVIAVFVFWEATSISSYFLIGFDHNRESARAAGLQALLVTGAGGLALLGVALFLAFVRLVRGPSLPDRVVALDLIAILAVGITAIYAIVTGQAVFLDVAIVLALIAFLGTVAFALYIEKQVSR